LWYHSCLMTADCLLVPPLVLAPGLGEVVARRALRAYPLEACGLLVGRREASAVVVAGVVRAANVLRSGDRYELATEAWLATWREAEIVGVWHSHPDHGAVPSPADRVTAWAEYSYLIAAVSKSGVSELRCWRLEHGVFREQPVVGGAVS